jgi:hypothetical protein
MDFRMCSKVVVVELIDVEEAVLQGWLVIFQRMCSWIREDPKEIKE